MTLVFKYPIYITEFQVISMPYGARIIHAGLDNENIPCVWAQVNPSGQKQDIKVWVVDTGVPLPDGIDKHVGTFLYDNRVIKHVFI